MAQPPVEFYFEFASPYAYLSSATIEALCARLGVALVWRPIVLGPILRRTGSRPLMQDGIRGAYARMDCLRWARLHGIDFRHWPAAPTRSLNAARGALHLLGRPGTGAPPAQALSFIHACFRAHFVDGRDLADDRLLADIVAGLGEDVEAFCAAIADPALKQRLIDETEAAFARGVFGTPTFFHGDEMLWGNDRLALLERLICEKRAPAAAAGGPGTHAPRAGAQP